MNRLANFAKALAGHVANGMKQATDEVLKARLAACASCPNLSDQRCTLCGCPVERKARWESSTCPDQPSRWSLL